MKLKVCGMTDKENIREILTDIQPDYMGFIFYALSSRFVENKLDPEYVKSLPDGIHKTGVFVDASEDYINDCARQYGLRTLQLHGNENPDFCRHFLEQGYEVIKVFHIYQSFDISMMNAYRDACDFFLFDRAGKYKGGNGVKFNWDILHQYTLQKPYFLSGGITPEDGPNITAIKDKRLYAVDINSRFEIDKGIKNADHIKKFYNKINNK
jgi:phosphoribosylanthranilate isomerase